MLDWTTLSLGYCFFYCALIGASLASSCSAIGRISVFRRLDDGRPEVPVEARWTRPDCEGPPSAQVHPREVRLRLLQHQDKHRQDFEYKKIVNKICSYM